MTNKTFALCVITTSVLFIFYAMSYYIGHQQLSFAVVASILLSFSLISFTRQRAKHASNNPAFNKACLNAVTK